MTKIEIDSIIAENKKRLSVINRKYDPITGEGSNTCARLPFRCKDIYRNDIMIPERCFQENIIKNINKCGSIKKFLKSKGLEYSQENIELVYEEYVKARIKWDFEFYAATCVVILDLISVEEVPFILNDAQQDFLKVVYEDWFGGVPCRYIIVKNRQNGFSTFIEMFFGWIQIIQRENMNSIICAHIENTSRIILGMYNLMIKRFPIEYTNYNGKLELLPYMGSNKTRIVKQTGSRMSIGSAERPDGLVGDNIKLFHASEVGLYQTTKGKTPEQLIQSIQSGIQHKGETFIVYESTARGVGNFLHKEWIRAINGESGFTPWFVPWFKNKAYMTKIKNYERFINTLNSEEIILFRKGATLEGLKWKRAKVKEYPDRWRFMQDFPATADEAFMSTGRRFYPIEDTERLRKGIMEPKLIGDIYGETNTGENSVVNLKIREESNGCLKVWFMPDEEIYSDRYVVVVDIGGLSEKSDRSVICVFDRKDMALGGVPVVAAEWCGHIDHDLLAWKAVQIATIYQEALLVIESNTLESEKTEGDHFEYILDEIAYYYNNMFCRTSPEKIREGLPAKWGFHTNKATKQLVCDHNKKALRENMYIETCAECCDEYDEFEVKENGSLGAIDGCHDDRHITRAIGVWACYQYLSAPRKRTKLSKKSRHKNMIINESSI